MSTYEPNPYLQASFACCAVVARCYAPDLTETVPNLPRAVRPMLYAVASFAALAYELTDPWQPATLGERALNELRMQATAALRWRFSSNPVLHALQQTVCVCHLDRTLLDDFFEALVQSPKPAWVPPDPSVVGRRTPRYSVAEVVALLVLAVLCADQPAVYQALQEPARYLGAALDKLAWLQGPALGAPRTHVPYYPSWNVYELPADCWEYVIHDIEHGLAVAESALPLLPDRVRSGVEQLVRRHEAQLPKLRRPPIAARGQAPVGWLSQLGDDVRQVWSWAIGL